jgi:hypothetical protein
LNTLTSRSSTTATSSSSSSFRHRKLDAVYLIFFVSHFTMTSRTYHVFFCSHHSLFYAHVSFSPGYFVLIRFISWRPLIAWRVSEAGNRKKGGSSVPPRSLPLLIYLSVYLLKTSDEKTRL